MKKLFFISSFAFLAFLPAFAFAVSDSANFNIDKNFDASGRSSTVASLVKTTNQIYFYIESDWWNSQNKISQEQILGSLESLSQEFENNIYPRLTYVFGSEWRPGIDGDSRITILFHSMKQDAGGYFRSTDEYLKVQLPDSNEREMVYLSLDQINNPDLKSFLAHEFVHLITFNQKDKINNVQEEIWLNEGRAEYASAILGYESYENSNLERRAKVFLEDPTDSLTEWQEKKDDYAVVNLFITYLVDHYGVDILSDSLKSKLAGIPSLNEALRKNGYKEDFSTIFTNWTIAVLVNDCSLGKYYCYLNPNLKDFKLNPPVNFLPLSGQSSLSVTNVTKNWSGNWQKFVGGSGILKFEFESLAGLNFKVPYLVIGSDGKYSINFISLDENEKGSVLISNFGSQNRALIIVPSLQSKLVGFDGAEPTYPFTFTASIVDRTPAEEDKLIQQLLATIDSLKKQIAEVQAKINAMSSASGQKNSACSGLNNNLLFGSSGNDVSCLQEFLKSLGSDVYPEGIVSGYFGEKTRAAVIRFQEKYASEILARYGLSVGNGIVGPATRAKINSIKGLTSG